jgi:SEFIR domain
MALELAERLRQDGIDAQIDQYVEGTPVEGWPRWMLNQLDWAGFVLVVCTETYYRRFRGLEEAEQGRGVDWEGSLITSEIYIAKSRKVKFVPVCLRQSDSRFVPEPLRGHTVYVLDSEQSYEELYAFLTGQAGIRPGELGRLKKLAGREVESLTFGERTKVKAPLQPRSSQADLSELRQQSFKGAAKRIANLMDGSCLRTRKNWTTLAQAAAGVVIVAATIVATPQSVAGTQGIRPFASFIVAVLIVIFILVMVRFRKREHAWLWAGFAAVLLALSVGNYFWYANLTDSLTVNWHEHTFVRGTELRPEVQKAYGSIISKPLATKLIEDAAGDPTLIWTEASIASSKTLLCISYLVMAPLIGGCILAASQVTICVTRQPSPKKVAKPGKRKPQVQ